MLPNLTYPLFNINVLDILPKNVSASTLNKVINRSQMETEGWHVSLKLRSKQQLC